jgi:hypothetical protein
VNRPPSPELAGLRIADPAARWDALGFTVADDRLELGGLELRLGSPGQGIVEWTLRHVEPGGEVDGLATAVTTDPPPPPAAHPNGAIAVDHVVIFTPDFDRTATALANRGMALRRVRDAGGFRQGFRRLGPAIIEIVEAPKAQPGPARFWGLVVVVADVEALRERLQTTLLGEPRPAVQPGRRIATLAAAAGLSPAVAFMDPEPPSDRGSS